MMKQHILLLLCAASVAGLIGCGENDYNDLNQYVDDVKRKPKEAIKPLPAEKKTESFAFEESRDPFKAPLKEIEVPEDHPNRPGHHIKEELEAFALDSLKMTGTVKVKSDLWGLVRTPDNTIHKVREGNYMGQNYGKIVRISPDKIELMEIMPDPHHSDRWIEQPMSLMLTDEQGGAK